MNTLLQKIESVILAKLLLRLSLGIGFLSAVADRFGLWGPPGAENVAWGNFQNFTAYTAVLNPWASLAVVSGLAILATAGEVVLGVCLLVGFKLRLTAIASAIMLLTFAVSMTFALSPKAPLDYSVWSAFAGAFALFILVSSQSK